MNDSPAGSVRLDKWLWAARFYKTRALAAEAIDGGKVSLNGDKAKRAKGVKPGDEIRVRHGAFEHVVHVTAVSEHRGSAAIAATLFEETAESKKARETLALQMKASAPSFRYEEGKPSKKDRRALDQLKRGMRD
jgi:ribosome-associated heat shock protein Hsp15